MKKLLDNYSKKGTKIRFAPLHLSNGGIAQYQGQCYILISSFDSLHEKRFTLSYLFAKVLEVDYDAKNLVSASLDSFGSLLRQEEVKKQGNGLESAGVA